MLLTATAAPAHAQDRVYRRTVREALREFQAGNWNEARVLFREAHDIFPNARTLRGIGMAYYEVRDYTDAYRYLQMALESDVRALDRRQRRATQDLAERAGQFIGYLRIEVTPDDAQVSIDMDEPRLERDGTILIDLQRHTLQVEAPDFITQTQNFSVDGGESRILRVDLQPVPPPPPPPPPPERFPIVPVLLGAAGGFAIMVGAGVGWYVNRSDELAKCEAAQADPTLDCENASTLSGQRDGAFAFTLISAGFALAAGAMALVLILTDDDEADPDAASVACAPAMLGVTCAGRF